jgi:hypothetical protein
VNVPSNTNSIFSALFHYSCTYSMISLLNKSIVVLGAICAFIIVGCVSYQPGTHNIQRQFSTSLENDEINRRVTNWLTQNGFVISSSSKTSISASSTNLDQLQGYSYDAWSGVAYSQPVCDCGRKPLGLGMSGGQIAVTFDQGPSGQSSLSKTSTIVTVNFTPTVNKQLVITCVSNGSIENQIRALLTQ